MADASRTIQLFLCKFYEVIAYGLHKDEISDMFKDGRAPNPKARASLFLTAICTFNFLITFLCDFKIESHLSGITIKLQGLLRCEVDQKVYITYKHAVLITKKVNVHPNVPRK